MNTKDIHRLGNLMKDLVYSVVAFHTANTMQIEIPSILLSLEKAQVHEYSALLCRKSPHWTRSLEHTMREHTKNCLKLVLSTCRENIAVCAIGLKPYMKTKGLYYVTEAAGVAMNNFFREHPFVVCRNLLSNVHNIMNDCFAEPDTDIYAILDNVLPCDHTLTCAHMDTANGHSFVSNHTVATCSQSHEALATSESNAVSHLVKDMQSMCYNQIGTKKRKSESVNSTEKKTPRYISVNKGASVKEDHMRVTHPILHAPVSVVGSKNAPIMHSTCTDTAEIPLHAACSLQNQDAISLPTSSTTHRNSKAKCIPITNPQQDVIMSIQDNTNIHNSVHSNVLTVTTSPDRVTSTGAQLWYEQMPRDNEANERRSSNTVTPATAELWYEQIPRDNDANGRRPSNTTTPATPATAELWYEQIPRDNEANERRLSNTATPAMAELWYEEIHRDKEANERKSSNTVTPTMDEPAYEQIPWDTEANELSDTDLLSISTPVPHE